MSESSFQPWIEYPEIWKTEAAYLSWLRGGIRRYLWSKNPVKLEFEKESQVKIPNTNLKSMKRFPTVSGYRCESCGGLFKANDVQCDHKTGEFALRSISDIQSFVEGIVLVRKDQLAMLCKPCHLVKTYSERYGVSKEVAKATIQAIEIERKGAKKVVDFLVKNGYNAQPNKELRREQLVHYFINNQENKDG